MLRTLSPYREGRRNAARSLAAFGKGGALFAAGNKIKKIIRAEPFGSARVFCLFQFFRRAFARLLSTCRT